MELHDTEQLCKLGLFEVNNIVPDIRRKALWLETSVCLKSACFEGWLKCNIDAGWPLALSMLSAM